MEKGDAELQKGVTYSSVDKLFWTRICGFHKYLVYIFLTLIVFVAANLTFLNSMILQSLHATQQIWKTDLTKSETAHWTIFRRHSSLKQNDTKLIVWYDYPGWMLKQEGKGWFSNCDIKTCKLSFDRKRLVEADAVLVHGVNLNINPSVRKPNQIWVMFGMESSVPHYYISLQRNKQWKNVFNWTWTYRQDSDIWRPYGKLAFKGKKENLNFTKIAKTKRKSVAWFVSHCETHSKREIYVKKLQKYIDVDIYGVCGPFKCPSSKENKCMELLNTTYRFYLAFENALCTDYITEKLFKTFSTNVVPVVRGGAKYEKYIPKGTFINTADFGSIETLGKYLRDLEKNTTAYAGFLQRKSEYKEIGDLYLTNMCEICHRLHDIENYRNIYPDVGAWMTHGMCHSPEDLK